MGNHAAEIRAQNAGLPVTRRGRRFVEFDLGDGRKRAVFTLDPLHVQGTETEIDTGFQPDTGAWQWKLGAADYQFHARSILNAGNLIEWRVGSQWVIFDPQSINWINQDTSRQQIAIKQAVTGQASDCTLSFPAGYGAGRHFEYTALPTRLVKEFTLDSLATLPAPTVTGTIWFEAEFTLSTSTGVDLYLDGVKWAKTNGVRVRTANQIEFRDAATGTQVLWRAAAPYAEDADGNRVAAEYEVRRSGGPGNLFITIRIPRSWLLTAVYPVRIDPTLDIQPDATAGVDTMAYEPGPTNTYPTFTTAWIGGGASNHASGLLEWDLSSIPAGVSYTSITESRWLNDDANTTVTIAINRILDANASWTEGGACWSYRVGTTAWAGSAGCATADTDYASANMGTFTSNSTDLAGTRYDVALDATEFEAMRASNNGHITRATNAGSYAKLRSSDHATASERPQLVVVYTAAGGSASLLALLGVG